MFGLMWKRDHEAALKMERAAYRDMRQHASQDHAGMANAIAARDAEIAELRQLNYALDRAADAFRRECKTARAGMSVAQTALMDIAEMETPHSAHIGRRMAARARQALPDDGPVAVAEAAQPNPQGSGPSPISRAADFDAQLPRPPSPGTQQAAGDRPQP